MTIAWFFPIHPKKPENSPRLVPSLNVPARSTAFPSLILFINSTSPTKTFVLHPRTFFQSHQSNSLLSHLQKTQTTQYHQHEVYCHPRHWHLVRFCVRPVELSPSVRCKSTSCPSRRDFNICLPMPPEVYIVKRLASNALLINSPMSSTAL